MSGMGGGGLNAGHGGGGYGKNDAYDLKVSV